MKKLKDKLFTYWRAFTEWAAGVVEKGKKKSTGKLSWLKTAGFLLLVVVAGLVIVGLISAFVLFCLAVPGLIGGTMLWAAFTWTGLGVKLFPGSTPFTWTEFFWLFGVTYWTISMFRKGKQPPILNNRDS